MKFLFFPGFEAPERALPLFEKLVENGPGWSRAAEAQFLVAYTQEETGEFEAAVASYEILHYRYPRSEYAEESVFRRAQCLYRVAKSAPRNEESCRQALASYSAFLRDYPDNPKAAEAGQTLDDLKDRLARMYYERAVFYDKRGKTRKSALIAYQDFVRRFPASDLAASARDRVAELEDEAETNENTP